MVRSEVAGVFDVLASRANVFKAVIRQSRTTAELANGPLMSRSTIGHGLRELERAGSVEARDAVHYSVLAGCMAFETYPQFVKCLDDTDTTAVVFNALDSDAPLAPVFLDGYEIVPVVDGDPRLVLSKLTSLVKEAELARECVRGAFSSQVDAYYWAVVGNDTPVDIVATGNMAQRLVTAYQPQLAET